jgi:hypothetical protein
LVGRYGEHWDSVLWFIATASAAAESGLETALLRSFPLPVVSSLDRAGDLRRADQSHELRKPLAG